MVTNLYLVNQYAHDPTFIVDMTKLWHLTQCWLKGVNANASNRNAVRGFIIWAIKRTKRLLFWTSEMLEEKII